jgi:hypothetical protein
MATVAQRQVIVQLVRSSGKKHWYWRVLLERTRKLRFACKPAFRSKRAALKDLDKELARRHIYSYMPLEVKCPKH